jgi:hypothetical protein
MARYKGGYYNRKRRSRRRVYLISAIIIVLTLIVIINLPDGKDAETNELPQLATIEVVEVVEPAPQPVPEPEPVIEEVELPKIVEEPAPKVNSEAEDAIDEVMQLLKDKPSSVVEVRGMLNEILHTLALSDEQRLFVKDQLSQLSEKWLFSRQVFEGDTLCGTYRVQPGDNLSSIGDKHYVPYDIIMTINGIARPQNLQANVPIKVVYGPFHARISRSTFTMDLYLQNTFVKSYPIGLGKEGRETPTGTWLVKHGGKLIAPTWTDTDTGKTYESYDPDYPLGSRWIGLKGIKDDAVGRTGFAIHGTKDASEIGKAASRGCIRLHNGSAIEVYNLMAEGCSQVIVED